MPTESSYLRDDGLVPVGQGPVDGQLQGLEHGELFLGGSVLVAGVVDDGVVVGVVRLHGRGRRVERPPPDLHLLLAVLGRRLGLVQPGQTYFRGAGIRILKIVVNSELGYFSRKIDAGVLTKEREMRLFK